MRRMLVLGTAALVLAGCGGGDGPSDEALVRGTLSTFAKAVKEHDYQTLCDKVFAPRLLRDLESIGLPCEIALSKSTLADVKDPQLTVGDVAVVGQHASAQIKTSAAGQPPSTDILELDKLDGSWRVSALGQGPGGGSGGSGGAATATPSSSR